MLSEEAIHTNFIVVWFYPNGEPYHYTTDAVIYPLDNMILEYISPYIYIQYMLFILSSADRRGESEIQQKT
jgi:hypothetical protein